MSSRQCIRTCSLITFVAAIGSVAWGCGDYGQAESQDTPALVQQLGLAAEQSSDDQRFTEVVKPVIEALRAQGRRGLDAAISLRDQRMSDLGDPQVAEVRRLDHAIDKIGAQKFATQSRLYWYTDAKQARQASIATGRPILSLRMLGRLDENLSCANSRFFRTMLYPDAEISQVLRDQFVLHWRPVRDVPVVTIDFGDGRQLQQPLTGNSAHLVLDSNGKPFDAMPGLVSPQAFRSWLDDVLNLWAEHDASQADRFWTVVRDFHSKRAAQRRSVSDLAIAKGQEVSELNPLDDRWNLLAATRLVTLSQPSASLLEAQQPNPEGMAADGAMRLAVTKSFAEIPLLRAVQPVESMIARDTAFNLFALQTKIDDWFAEASEPAGYKDLTDRIYADVFLMPLTDPWLGLSSDTRYAALDNGGRIESDRLIANRTAAKQQVSSPRASSVKP